MTSGDLPVEGAQESQQSAADGLAAQQGMAAQIRALQVGAYLLCGQDVQSSTWRRDLMSVSPGLPLFTNARRV